MNRLPKIATATLIIIAASIVWIYAVEPGHANPIPSVWRSSQHVQSFEYKAARIDYIEEGQGPILLLLHGGGTWSYSFHKNIGTLAKHFRVIAMDMPGHGFSEIPENYGYSLLDTRNVIEALRRHLGADRLSIAGNSWGGGWALDYAEHFPEHTAALILIDAAGLADTVEADQSSWPYLTVPILGRAILHGVFRFTVADGYRSTLFHDGSKVRESTIDEVYNALSWTPNLLAQIKYQKNLKWEETDVRMSTLRCPVLIIWGQYDEYLDPSMASRMAFKIPDATLVFLPTSHLPQEEDPAAVNQRILDFLSQ